MPNPNIERNNHLTISENDFIDEHKANFEKKLAEFESETFNEETDPFREIKTNKLYSLKELSELFNWPIEDGFAIFLNYLRNNNVLGHKLFTKTSTKLEKTADNQYKFITIKKTEPK